MAATIWQITPTGGSSGQKLGLFNKRHESTIRRGMRLVNFRFESWVEASEPASEPLEIIEIIAVLL